MMWGWLDRLAPLLLDASLAAAVLSSLYLAFLLMCLQPARRIALARTAILAVLAIVPLTAFAPWPRFHVIRSPKRSVLPPRQIFVRRASSKLSAQDVQRADRDAIATVPIGEDPKLSSHWIRAAQFARRPVRLIVLAYLTIVFLGLAWGTLGYLGIWWLIRSSSEPSPHTMSVFESLLAKTDHLLTPKKQVHLRISDRVVRPVVVALLNPTILLPPHFDEPDRDDEEAKNLDSDGLRLSLLHELAHVGRHDASFQMIGSVAQAFWFFLPQLWFIRSQLRLDQEFLADHVASRAYGTSSEYAASLLDLAAAQGSQPAAQTPASSSSGGARTNPKFAVDAPGAIVASSLGQRLLMLLHCPYRLEPKVPPGWLWGLRVMGVVATFALANVSLRLPGMAYASSPEATTPIEGVFLTGINRFQVSELIIAPSGTAETGRSGSYVVPYRLPEHYSLTLDVLASQERLSQIRLMDRPLAQTGEATADHSTTSSRIGSHAASNPGAGNHPNPDRDEHWHRIRVERDARGISLSVDQHALPCPSQSTHSLIRVESPAGKPVELRNLIVTPTS